MFVNIKMAENLIKISLINNFKTALQKYAKFNDKYWRTYMYR